MNLSNEVIFFGGFALFTIFVMLLDLGAFSSKKEHVVKFKEAAFWSAVWVSLAIAFYFFLRHYGHWVHDVSDAAHLQHIKDEFYPAIDFTGDYVRDMTLFQNNMALEYITGYLVEYSLSVDNIFVLF